jgi:hypothetical protein
MHPRAPLFLLRFAFFSFLALFGAACTSPRVASKTAAMSDDPGGASDGASDPGDTLGPDDPSDIDDAEPPPGDDGADDPSTDADPAVGDPSADGDDEASADAAALPPFDAGEGGTCETPPGAGDLVIDELMIASVAGTGDHGEWLEVSSRLGCALDLRGLRGTAPSGSKVQTFTVADDLWIPAYGAFVVADSSIGAINHDVPGVVVVWAGQPGDVLRNAGATVTIEYDDVLVDTVTYPSMTLTDGVSLAFPPDCPASARTDWTKWQLSNASWFPGFRGTPGAPNVDVRCP